MTAYLPLRLASALLTLSLAAAWAQPVPYDGVPGGAEWATGDFVAAYRVAVQADSPVAQLLASRAAADQAVYVEEEPAPALDWLDLSESAARRSLELDPDDPVALDTRAHVHIALGNGDLALADFERAMTVGGAEIVRLLHRSLQDLGYDAGPAQDTSTPQLRSALAACIAAKCRLLD